MQPSNAHQPALRRALGPWSTVAIIMGTVIGSGIFLVPTDMVKAVGTPGMVFAVWVFGGVLSLFGALTYAELSAALPEAGGEYAYLTAAYGPFLGIPLRVDANLGCQERLDRGARDRVLPLSGRFSSRLASAVVRRALAHRAGRRAARNSIRTTAGDLPDPAFVGRELSRRAGRRARAGRRHGAESASDRRRDCDRIALAPGTRPQSLHFYDAYARGPAGFFVALVAALWAYDGWNNAGMLGSEVENPQRTFPLALIAGVTAIIGVYLLTNLAYFSVLNAGEVASSDRVAADMMRRIAGPHGAGAVSVAAMISIFAALNGSILSGSRVPYAMARDGYFFRHIGRGPSHFPDSFRQYSAAGSMVLFICLERALQRFVQCGDLSQLDSLRDDRCRRDRFAPKEAGFGTPLSDLGLSLGAFGVRWGYYIASLPNARFFAARIWDRIGRYCPGSTILLLLETTPE